MTDDQRRRADERLESALPGTGLRDPRPFYRPVLKHLRDRDADAFARALDHFESVLVPALAAGADALEGWLDYGVLLADAVGPGRLVEVDGTGRARAVGDPASAAGLLLHLPDDPGAPALLLRYPAASSPAQDATVELLVAGRVTASAYG